MHYLVDETPLFSTRFKKVPDMTKYFQSEIQALAHELDNSYDAFKSAEIVSCRFSQAEMLKWLYPYEDQSLLKKCSLGVSGEGRNIFLYSFGSGQTRVMLWSQMHGDEPTATMALVDMLSFFAKNPEHIVTRTISGKLHLLIIPMLNPDGAESFTRRTAQMIDINRDALSLETPEARILKEARDKFLPEYGFNLHDQDPRLTVGKTKKIAAIALLAPPVDESGTDNLVRARAKKVASIFAQSLNQFIPGYISRWDDSFEPRSFGDSMQKSGTSTVLVESGGWRGDPDKFFIRRLNCIGLLTTLHAIAAGKIDEADIGIYEQIPLNMKLGFDQIIRNAVFKVDGLLSPVRVDVGINFERRLNPVTGRLDDYATIAEIGDLHMFTALEKEVDAKGTELQANRIKVDHSFPLVEVELLLKRT